MTECTSKPVVPTTVTYYANIYPQMIGACGHVYASRELADQMAAAGRIICVAFPVELPEEGKDADEGKPG